jgi:DNA repair exonuclease SbcCD ATPase subunit
MQANAKISDDVIKEQLERIESLSKLAADLQKGIDNLKNSNTESENAVLQDLRNKLNQSETEKTKLGNELSELRTRYRDYDSVKNQATHIDTFKTELIKAREENNRIRSELEAKINSITSENNGKVSALTQQHDKDIARLTEQHNKNIERLTEKYDNKVDELIAKIEYLQLPPAKRKKIDELNKEMEPAIASDDSGTNSPIKDGGSF